MRYLFILLLIISCRVERPVQVKELEVICKAVTIVLRNDGLHYWTRWETKNGQFVYDSYGRKKYTIGEVKVLLVKS